MIIIHAMNNHAGYLRRFIEPALTQALRAFPVVIVTGARQTGKSTLVQHAFPKRRYVTLDDVDVLEQANEHPDSLVGQREAITIDEVQRSPRLLLAVKRAVDRHRIPGQFILTGSANLLLMKRVGESLAGRAAYLTLMPMTRRETLGSPSAGIWGDLFTLPPDEWPRLIANQKAAQDNWESLARRSGYPVPALHMQESKDRAAWYAGYAKTYLERDLQDFTRVGSLMDFRRLMRAVCLRLGNMVNQTELARDVGLSQPTVMRHLNALEASYQLVRVPAYAVNRTKRLIKTPKAYWTDTGLALRLAGESVPRGCHLENLVLSDLIAWSGVGNGAEVMYWRATTGEEVDFVIERNGKLLPVEVKATARLRSADTRHLLLFRREYRKVALPALLLHTGDEVKWLADGVLAAPWWKVM